MKLPIGISDFKDLVEGGYYFVDKSLFIKNIINESAKVVLLTRPRRFGKTINMSMLHYYFTNDISESKSDLFSDLFSDLLINEEKELNAKHYHQYPTIFISFKDAKATSYTNAIAMISHIIAKTYKKHQSEDLFKVLSLNEQQYFTRIVNNNATITELKISLVELIEFLHRLNNKQVIVLIDEYDTPVHAAYHNNYYDEFIDVFKTFLGAALKDNMPGTIPLHKAIITGITRVAQASIFSELNNFKPYSLLDERYGEYFGFTQTQVEQLLKLCNATSAAKEIKDWYNGYTVGEHVLYNPWSILNCLHDNIKLSPYWLNTSDNLLIKTIISTAKPAVKYELSKLMQGEAVDLPIKENIIFQELKNNEEAIWALLLYSGYLTAKGQQRQGRRLLANLQIPNQEVMFVYDEIIEGWFSADIIDLREYDKFTNSLVNGDLNTFEQILQSYIEQSGSYFDFNTHTKEQVFHSLILGLVLGLRNNYIIKSNQESGYGRLDVALIPKDTNKSGIIIELKVAKSVNELEATAQMALQQIIDKKYTDIFTSHGVSNILMLGIAFAGKNLKLLAQNSCS